MLPFSWPGASSSFPKFYLVFPVIFLSLPMFISSATLPCRSAQQSGGQDAVGMFVCALGGGYILSLFHFFFLNPQILSWTFFWTLCNSLLSHPLLSFCFLPHLPLLAQKRVDSWRFVRAMGSAFLLLSWYTLLILQILSWVTFLWLSFCGHNLLTHFFNFRNPLLMLQQVGGQGPTKVWGYSIALWSAL